MRQILTLLVLASFLAACSASGSKMPADNVVPVGANGGYGKVGKPYKISGKWYYPAVDQAYDEVGIASWYGKQFHGKKTANGEIYNMNSLTAAHKTLPLPTNVKVTNLQNGRSIIVRVNDRGPFVGDRVIDLSRRAAQVLGFTNQGTTKVRVQVVDQYGKVAKPNKRYAKNTQRQKSSGFRNSQATREAKQSKASSGVIQVQVGSFRTKDNAHSRVRELKSAGIRATITKAVVNGLMYFRVIAGSYSSRGAADTTLETVQARGFFDAHVIIN